MEQGIEGVAHAPLRLGIARPLHIGGVAEQGQYPLPPQLSQPGQVDHAAGDGGGVDLKVAGVDAHPGGGVDGEGHRIGDGVVHMDELHAEPPRLHRIPRLTHHQLGLAQQVMLLQLQPDKAGGHTGGVHRHIQFPQEVGQRADMVLVAVGDEDAPDAVSVFQQVGEIGNDHVDAVHIVIGEAHAGVHHHHVVAVLIYGHVLADLVETAKGDDFQFFCHW